MKYGAKGVVFSYRSRPLGYQWPENMEEHPLLTHLEGNIAHFKDGEQRSILFYLNHSFSFLYFFSLLCSYIYFLSFYDSLKSNLHAGKVDAVILCTGYLHYFPFMSDELRLRSRNVVYPPNLYKVNTRYFFFFLLYLSIFFLLSIPMTSSYSIIIIIIIILRVFHG